MRRESTDDRRQRYPLPDDLLHLPRAAHANGAREWRACKIYGLVPIQGQVHDRRAPAQEGGHRLTQVANACRYLARAMVKCTR